MMTGHDLGGITSALADVDLGKVKDDQKRADAQPLTSTASRSSNDDDSAAHSAYGAQARGSGGERDGSASTSSSIQIRRPSYLRQSLSDGTSQGTSSGDTFQGIDVSFGAASLPNNDVPVSLATSGPLSASDPRTQLYVSNLPYRVRWQDLKDLFRRAGTVLRADVSLTPENRSRGFGTVLLATEDDARRACEMFRGFNWQGRTLDVKIDRSGTLLGVGVPQLAPTAALMATASVVPGVTPHASTPLSPSAAIFGGASPSLSTLSSHSVVAPSSAASSHLNLMQDKLSPTPSTGSPAPSAQGQRPALGNLSPGSNIINAPTNGVSPALLPFLNSSTRASLTAGSSSPLFNATSAGTQQQQGSYGLIQQRSASLGGAGVVGPGHASLAGRLPQTGLQASSPPYFGAANNVPSLTNLGPQAMRQTLVGSIVPTTTSYGQQINSVGGVVLPQMQAGTAAPVTQSHAYYGRVLFVGNLPFHCQWQDLKDLFRAAGNIQRADVALTGEGKSRGFGTVLFATPEDAQNAVRIYHGYEYSGRTLKVHFDRFAQMTVPPPGTLPASPAQYTSAFAAANTPTPVSNTMGHGAAHQMLGQQHAYQPQNFNQIYAAQTQQQQQQQQQHQQFGFAHGTYLPYQQSGFSVAARQQASFNGSVAKQGDAPSSFSSPFAVPQHQHGSFSFASPFTQSGSPFASALGYSGLQNDSQQSMQAKGTGFSNGNGSTAYEEEKGRRVAEDKRSEAEKRDEKGTSTESVTASQALNHPGRIELPPQQFAAPMVAAFSPMHPRMSVPMTPGMPGFTFHAIPDTPPVVPHHYLSPGLGGPFSPPLASPTFNGPATPGAPYVGLGRPYNPAMNAAPGAPVHAVNGGVTPLDGGFASSDASNFNPMFPPIGTQYQPWPAQEPAYGQQNQQQQRQETRLPQTPHWSQPRPPRKDRGTATEALTEEGEGKGGVDRSQDPALLEIQQSTGASSTEELARKIAQMSAQKVLLQQQQRVRGGSVPSSAADNEAGKAATSSETRSQSSSMGSALDAPSDWKLNRRPSQLRLSSSALSGSALDDESYGQSSRESHEGGGDG